MNKAMWPQPYEAYAERLRQDIDRIRQDWAAGQQKFILLSIGGGTVGLALLASVLIASGQTFFPDWLGPSVLVVSAMALLVLFGFKRRSTGVALIRLCVSETHLACPHCDLEIDLTEVWQCGWCGVINNERLPFSPHLVFDGCMHRGHHVPGAIKCTHCGNDIIRDQNAYALERRIDAWNPRGIAVFLAQGEPKTRTG